MSSTKRKPAATAIANGLPNCFPDGISNREFTAAALHIQRRRVAERFGLTPPVAALIVELAGLGRDVTR